MGRCEEVHESRKIILCMVLSPGDWTHGLRSWNASGDPKSIIAQSLRNDTGWC